MTPQGILVLSILIGTGLPMLTGLVSKQSWDSGLKAMIQLLLSAATGLGSEVLNSAVNNTEYNLLTGVITALGVWIAGIASYYGLLVPTKASFWAAAHGNTDPGASRNSRGDAPLV